MTVLVSLVAVVPAVMVLLPLPVRLMLFTAVAVIGSAGVAFEPVCCTESRPSTASFVKGPLSRLVTLRMVGNSLFPSLRPRVCERSVGLGEWRMECVFVERACVECVECVRTV